MDTGIQESDNLYELSIKIQYSPQVIHKWVLPLGWGYTTRQVIDFSCYLQSLEGYL